MRSLLTEVLCTISRPVCTHVVRRGYLTTNTDYIPVVWGLGVEERVVETTRLGEGQETAQHW